MYYLGINTDCRYSVFTETLLSWFNYNTAAEAVENFNYSSVFNYTNKNKFNARFILTDTKLYGNNDAFTIIAKVTSLPEFELLYPELFI